MTETTKRRGRPKQELMGPPKRNGRPPEPVPEHHIEAICLWISQGKTLRAWCRENDIHYCTVYEWIDKDERFSQRFAKARDTGYDVIAEECFAIADEMPPVDSNGKTDSGYVAWQKNRIWTGTQLLARWNPKKYGNQSGTTEGQKPASVHITWHQDE